MTSLTSAERRTLACITAAAAGGHRFPTCDDLADAVGCEAVSTTVRLVGNLERKGYIRVDRYQRERQATILATGQKTAEPRTKARHWREREQHISEPLRIVSAQDGALFQAVLVAARHARKSPEQFAAVLIREAMAARSIQSGAKGA